MKTDQAVTPSSLIPLPSSFIFHPSSLSDSNMARKPKTARKKQLLRYLQGGTNRPVGAEELAAVLQIGGKTRDLRTRPVRALIRELRNQDGHCICADCHPTEGGYWMARSDDEWHRYKEARRSGARYEFVMVRRMAEASRDRRSGQMRLAIG